MQGVTECKTGKRSGAVIRIKINRNENNKGAVLLCRKRTRKVGGGGERKIVLISVAN